MYPCDKSKTKRGWGYWQSYPNNDFFQERKLAGRPHYGVDILPRDKYVDQKGNLLEDFPIYAMVDGVVEDVYESGSYGRILKQGFKTSTEPYRQFRYAHCKRIYVKKGDMLKKGQLIGLIGNTGSSNWPHVHIEARKYKGERLVPIDPEIYLT